ncbi:hypothetical protein [Endothiovibrio diazotrophicus]
MYNKAIKNDVSTLRFATHFMAALAPKEKSTVLIGMEGKIHFQEIKEDRGNYYVVYRPPMPDYRFAILHLMFPEEGVSEERVADLMEKELKEWLDRFPIPLLVSSFNYRKSIFGLNGVRPRTHLTGFFKKDNSIFMSWELIGDDNFPDIALDKLFLLKVYSGVKYKTSEDIDKDVKQHILQRRVGWYIVFFWAVVLPVSVALLEYFSPEWVAFLVLCFSLYKAARTALEMMGKVERGQKEIEKEEEERKMRHHHYHCELNPDGFLWLKLENFKKDSIQKVKDEHNEIKSGAKEMG